MQKDMIFNIIKGVCVGGTMLVPGVSGGSMAMILGIYDRLVSSVSSFMKHKKASILFLLPFALGGLVGIVLFSKPLLHLIERFPMPMLYLFMGAVAGGLPMMFRKADIRAFSWRPIVYPLAGLILVLSLSQLPTSFQPETESGLLSIVLLVIAGIIAAVALVLPGISVSYMLLLMGLYDETMHAIGTFYMPHLIPLGIGLLVGIICTTKCLEKAMTLHPQPTYLIIIGFVLGSVVEVFPGIPTGIQIPICLLTFLLGFGIIYLLSRVESRHCEA